MPTRLWRHGIHAFLEVLRYGLPESLEHMVTFIYIAYSMLANLYEKVSIFEDIWIECLGRIFFVSYKRKCSLTVVQGNIARYRMAIEDDDLKAHEVWSSIARFWYNKASQKSPNVGRLYHHLAILTPWYSMEQLSLYTRSLTCITPFESARESLITVFKPFLHTVGRSAVERSLICAHTILVIDQTQNSNAKFDAIFDGLVADGKCIAAVRLGNFGAFAAISNIAALFEYGIPKSRLRLAYEVARKMKDTASEFEPHDPIGLDSNAMMPLDHGIPSSLFTKASRLASETLELWLNCGTDKEIYPLLHIYLVFIRSLIVAQEAWKPFENDAAWRTIGRDIPCYPLCSFLNTVAGKFHSTSTIFAEDFPQSRDQNDDKAVDRPLPEDFTLRGQMYSQWYFPRTWFAKTLVDGDEHNVELPSMNEARIERILWLGHRIASVCHIFLE